MTGRALRLSLPLLLLLAGTARVALAQSGAADHYLDLVSYLHAPQPAADPSPLTLPGAAIDFERAVPSAAKLRIALASLDGREFAWGDEVVYEVLIENVGAEAVSLPWTPDPYLLPAGERAALAAVTLEVAASPDAAPSALRVQPLFGAASVMGTTMALEPGESALIRVRGAFTGVSASTIDDLVPDRAPAAITIKARFDLYGEGLLVTSTNAIEATLSRPVP